MIKIIGVICFMFTITVFGASFDCSKAGTSTEKAICSYPELSALDERLSLAYRTATISTSDQFQLKHDQRKWLSEVRNKCEDTNCLMQAYHNRINDLNISSPIQPKEIQTDVVNQEAEQQSEVEKSEVVQSQVVQPELIAPEVIEPELEQLQITTSPEPTTNNQLATLEPEDKPNIINASEPSSAKSDSGITNFQKILGLALLGNLLLTIYFHRAGKLIIYRDYTDAAITGSAPLVGILIFFILVFVEVSFDTALIISIGIFAFFMFFVVNSTYKNNHGLSIFFVMSLITKITIFSLYFVIMVALILGFSTSRENGETNKDYEARKKRNAKAQAAAMAGTTVGFVGLIAWVCKNSEFTNIEEYFSLKAIESAC